MKILLTCFLGVALFWSCKTNSSSTIDFDYYFSADEQKEVLAKIISYVYIAPPNVAKEERFLARHRPFYLKESLKFQVVRFFKDDKSRYYFYLLRPARNVKDYKRGVSGMFTLDKKGEINSFKEFFVTKMIPETEVINFGKLIFDDLINNKGSIPMTPLREDFIEFPGMMSQYDTTLYEWTYKEPLDLKLNDTIK
jgi:hypothetical protein